MKTLFPLVVLGMVGMLFGCGPAPEPQTPSSMPSEPVALESEIKPEESPEPAQASAPEEQEQPAQPEEELSSVPLPKGTTVLHVGSSMAEALGRDLKRELEDRGVRCILNAQTATYIPDWAWDRKGLRQLIANHNPDLVIITLGGNEVAMPDPSIRAKAIQQLVSIVGDRPCIWVSSPRWEHLPHTGILEVIEQNIAPCRFVDTDQVIPNMKPHTDRIHPTISERRRWAKVMIRWFEYNIDPQGKRPWDLRPEFRLPPPEESAE